MDNFCYKHHMSPELNELNTANQYQWKVMGYKDKTMMCVLHYVKRPSWVEVTPNSEKIKTIAIALSYKFQSITRSIEN